MNMKIKLLYLFLFCLLNTVIINAQKMTDYVDPLIGSGGHGHVFVGVSTPFGAVKLGPENIYKGWDWCSGYNYGDSILIGFAHLHLSGTGIGDLADILIMPYTGPVRLDKGTEQNHHAGYSSIYSHKDEKVTPGYYSIKLEDGINVELTATERVGYHKYHFPSGKNAHIIIDLKEGINDKSTDTQIEQTDEYTLKGYRFSSGWAKEQQAFFAIRFSQPIQKLELYDNDKLLEGKSAKGLAIKGLISFEKTPGTVQFKVGISPVSADNALANIEAEIPNWDFAKIVKETEEKWNKELSKVIVTTKSLTDKRVFYTALFHSMMHPSLFDDHNGDYQGADNKIYKKSTFTNYTVFSLWDTYRAAHPLYTLLNPDRVDDFVNTMLSIYDQQGFLPIWHLNGYETGTMVGISSLQVIAEAYLKGFRGFDAERAYNAIKTTAMSDTRGLNYVRDFKPIPSDARVGSPVALAMEYAISDGRL
jgi:predicted alpha-1,2-mannosidase